MFMYDFGMIYSFFVFSIHRAIFSQKISCFKMDRVSQIAKRILRIVEELPPPPRPPAIIDNVTRRNFISRLPNPTENAIAECYIDLLSLDFHFDTRLRELLGLNQTHIRLTDFFKLILLDDQPHVAMIFENYLISVQQHDFKTLMQSSLRVNFRFKPSKNELKHVLMSAYFVDQTKGFQYPHVLKLIIQDLGLIAPFGGVQYQLKGSENLIAKMHKLVQATSQDKFTKREKQIIQYICRGTPNQQIAQELHISVSTVKTHLSKIYRKSDCKGRFELMAKYRTSINRYKEP